MQRFVSAYDIMSRKVLQGLCNVEGGRVALPFVSMFHGAPSQYLEDDSGTVRPRGGRRASGCMNALVVLPWPTWRIVETAFGGVA